MRYSVAGRSADTAATANHVAAQLWNPDANTSLYVVEVQWFLVGATVSNAAIARSTARGATPGTSVTPDGDNAYNRPADTPPSGPVLELAAFGTQPTLATPAMYQGSAPAAQGAGYIWSFRDPGIEVPAGTGLCVYTPVAVILQDSDFTFVFDDG
jgi:hypothetical protein